MGINVFLQSLAGKTYTFFVENYTTIKELKEMYMDKSGVPPDQARIIFAGRQLEDTRTLSDYNIGADAILYCVLKLRGADGLQNNRLVPIGSSPPKEDTSDHGFKF